MVETFAGLLALFFGWLCLSHVVKVRSLYSKDSPRRSRFHGENPLMIIPSALGVFLLINGMTLLKLAAVRWLKPSGASVSWVIPDLIITLALAAVGVASLIWFGASLHRGVPSAGREGTHNKRPRSRTAPPTGSGRDLPSDGASSRCTLG